MATEIVQFQQEIHLQMVHVAMFFRFSWYSQFEGLGIATIISKKSNPLNKSTYQYIIGPRVYSNSFAYFTHPGFFYLKKNGKSSLTNHRLAVRLSLSLLRGFLSKRFSTEVEKKPGCFVGILTTTWLAYRTQIKWGFVQTPSIVVVGNHIF